MQRQLILTDWAAEVEKYWEATGNTKRELLQLIYHVQDIAGQLEQSFVHVRDQRNRVQDIQKNLEQLYRLRFQEDPPPRSENEPTQLIVLNTPEDRSEAIKEAALALAEPGSDISSDNVLDYLTERGIRIVAKNPKATIASVLYQFDSEFEKVRGRRSVFRRRIKDSHDP